MDIANVWEEANMRPANNHDTLDYVVYRGCRGRSLDSAHGPGTWDWGGPVPGDLFAALRAPKASGASYITMPQALPPTASTSK